MLIAYWIVAGLTAAAFLITGALKLVRSKEKLIASGLRWSEDFSPNMIRLAGVAEIAGAIGVIVPMATGVALILSPIAAVCLALLMVGASVVHARRHEPPIAVPTLVLAVATAVLGFALVLS